MKHTTLTINFGYTNFECLHGDNILDGDSVLDEVNLWKCHMNYAIFSQTLWKIIQMLLPQIIL